MNTTHPRARSVAASSASILGLGLVAFAFLHAGCGGGDSTPGATPGSDGGANDTGGGSSDGTAADVGTGLDSAPVNDAPANDSPNGATVTGKVVGLGFSGIPSATVLIQGKTATTSATGTFSISGVTVPYDVTALVPTGALSPANAPVVTTFAGLTGTSPLLFAFSAGTDNTANLAGTLNGGDGFPSATYGYSVVADGPSLTRANGNGGSTGTQGIFDLSVYWPADQGPVGVSVHAIQFSPATGIPSAYAGHGVDISPGVAPGASLQNHLISLTPITTSTVSGTITVPTGYTVVRHYLVARPGKPGAFQWSELSTATDFSYTAPNIGSGTLEVSATATGPLGEYSSGAKKGIVNTGATAVAITMPTAPAQTTPAANATGVDPTTSFAWAASVTTGCVYWVQATSTVAGSPQYHLYTTATTIRLPDLTAKGITPPSGGAYNWEVSCLTPFTSVDGVAGAVGIFGYESTASSPQSPFLMK